MSGEWYHWIKALHIIAVISWMAGMLYLPRLFVYHTQVKIGSEASELFKIMERRLLRVIINPAMIVTWLAGFWLVKYTNAVDPQRGLWMHYKLALVIVMTICHIILSRFRRNFESDKNTKSEAFFRVFNEVITVLMVGIVILVVVKPV